MAFTNSVSRRDRGKWKQRPISTKKILKSARVKSFFFSVNQQPWTIQPTLSYFVLRRAVATCNGILRVAFSSLVAIKCVAILVREARKFRIFLEQRKNIREWRKKSPIVTHTGHSITLYYFIQTYLGGIKKERYPRKTLETYLYVCQCSSVFVWHIKVYRRKKKIN